MEERKEILRVEDLHKSYGTNKVLQGISLNIKQGQTKVIIGPSGTGKSTLLTCVNYLNPPDKGRIWLEGEEIIYSEREINKIRQKKGFVFQQFNLFNHLTALGNVMVGLTEVLKKKKKEAREKAMYELERVGMADCAEQYPAELSGGQQQRVGIARALAMDPLLIMFDEPTSALDPELMGEVLDNMTKLALEGMTLLVVTHEMGFARAVADDIIFMENGRIVEEGPPEKLIMNPEKKRTIEFLQKITQLYGED